MALLQRLFGDPNERELKKLWEIVRVVNGFEEKIKALKDEELRAKTGEFRRRLEAGESLDDLLPEAFAVVREAACRTLGMRHFDVQILGGIVLHQGKIAEMKTGEGKTLVAPLAAYLNALEGKGVHIVTVNDYLARRDSEWMGKIYRFLGLEVGLIVHGLSPDQRKKAYAADVVYGTNNEFGFDYLRDNMVTRKENLVQRSLHYAIIDEVDSILIDEARTPLIISGQAGKPPEIYKTINAAVLRLVHSGKVVYKRGDEEVTREEQGDHYIEVDEKAHTAVLTDRGQDMIEKILGFKVYGSAGTEEEDDGDEEDSATLEKMEYQGMIKQALKAHTLMKRDREYVVKDGEVVIVDEFTGRLMFGRRYSDGLHQAIEAKEGVEVARDSQTLASITFQNYFRMYKKLAGMTGTAKTEEDEFIKIYNLPVVVIPTNKEMIREDLPDVIYKTERAKFNAVVEEIVDRHHRGQPVLVGTISIEKSEQLSSLLSRRGIRHNVLNAKHHEREAEIVAQAGKKGAVTIATNMAGRGTDIVLGGNIDADKEAILASEELSAAEKERQLAEMQAGWQKEHDEVVSLGGLHIIGTERHESRRIDNQLRGRAGRQGDPGSSQFFISLEDDLMRLFGGDSIAGVMDKLGVDENVPIDHPLISRAIENAQKKVEARNFDIRKHVLEYDDVINQQREIIYRQRRQVLEGENIGEIILGMIEEVVEATVLRFCDENIFPEDWDLQALIEAGEELFLPAGALQKADLEGKSAAEIKELFLDRAVKLYEHREKTLGKEIFQELGRVVLLRVVDRKWMEHLDIMDDLRQGIGLRAYGQRNPLLEYKNEAYMAFQAMVETIKEEVVRFIFRVQLSGSPAGRLAAPGVVASQETRENVTLLGGGKPAKQQPRRVEKIGRNDPCPCGSGKKYKKCCGR